VNGFRQRPRPIGLSQWPAAGACTVPDRHSWPAYGQRTTPMPALNQKREAGGRQRNGADLLLFGRPVGVHAGPKCGGPQSGFASCTPAAFSPDQIYEIRSANSGLAPLRWPRPLIQPPRGCRREVRRRERSAASRIRSPRRGVALPTAESILAMREAVIGLRRSGRQSDGHEAIASPPMAWKNQPAGLPASPPSTARMSWEQPHRNAVGQSPLTVQRPSRKERCSR